jgi:hypothetical protein
MLCGVEWYQLGGEAFIRAVNPVYVSKTRSTHLTINLAGNPGVSEVATDTNNILSKLSTRNYKL